MLALMSFGGIGGLVLLLWGDGDGEDKPRDRDQDRYSSVNPIDQYFTTYTDGNLSLWEETLKRFDAGEFRDWKDMNDFQQKELDGIKKKSEKNSIDAIESINGKLWVAQKPEQEDEVERNRSKAREVIKSFVDGYEKWAR